MSLRDVLLAAGVDAGELAHAIDESRRLVRRTSAGARVLSGFLEQVSTRAKPGSKAQIVAAAGSFWLEQLAEQTGSMVRRTGKR